ncbi:unnamed protein product [Lasius platythorax]|uniref:Uncharacterized protein n=1 Tax=Lasius platythorax TaxID=488582 RepID=A0AAV2NXF8_9HYME
MNQLSDYMVFGIETARERLVTPLAVGEGFIPHPRVADKCAANTLLDLKNRHEYLALSDHPFGKPKKQPDPG